MGLSARTFALLSQTSLPPKKGSVCKAAIVSWTRAAPGGGVVGGPVDDLHPELARVRGRELVGEFARPGFHRALVAADDGGDVLRGGFELGHAVRR